MSEKSQKGDLISALQEAQEIHGYLPESVLTQISEELKTPLSQIYGVVTFYSQFHLTPRGRNTIRVCMGTACYVHGSEEILEKLEESLNIKVSQTTEDLRFTLETVRCLGTCFLAPVMMINRDYYGKLTPQKIDPILEQYK